MSKRSSTRKPVRFLPHKHTSGLFLRDGEYVAGIKPDSGGRTIRKLGRDRERATKLFDELLDDLGNGGENPSITKSITERFLPTQERLASYATSANCVRVSGGAVFNRR